MKSTIIAAAIALAVPAVYAQLDSLPECATPCLVSNLSASGCENPTDFKCVCSSQPFVDSATGCISTSCKGDDIKTAITAATTLCKGYGVDIKVPTPEEPETTSAPVAETTSTPVAETTTVEETTTVVETTTVAETTTTVIVETPVDTTTVVVTTTTPTGTGNVSPPGNTTTPTVPPPTTSDNAAVKNIAGLGATVMAIAALFAL